MSSNSLTSWLLIACTILTFLVWAVLWSVLIGDGETAKEAVAENMAKPELARAIGSLGIVVFVATLLRLGFLSRSMQGEDKPGAATTLRATYP